ncbi:DUF6268 family outer membrane beta-barrel protein [Jejuia pallidilutea]|uniref:DUF6268 domain-containing protein n=1 Tax=Jejuia pallidilutea TaxID=504487 RepID=A0A090W227_9FLAO|nr:DUF6268 family outer membrane beta-barrel protein [Jejuia pallidilutea]GAL67369.1 hypothetical protein JCM19301_2721 [Jejuia pallidilutea]GAL70971.1 hypothetical protein JCM19302_2926 [Jejuia pallidilutea]GAL90086.1 hypothetical protein JCM19538_827 [Jejuia pallidilutea]
MLKNLSISLCLFLGVNVCFAQLTDLARLEYSFIPQSKSEDQYTRLRALLNYPIEVKEDTYLVIGAEYNNVILNLEENYPFDTSGLNNIHVIDLNLGYTFKWNEKWRLGLKFNPRIASTLTKSIVSDDFFLNGGVYIINDRTDDTSLKRPFRLILGLTYNATTGIPFPLPFVSYYREINERWSFNAGVPKSNIKYALNANNNIQAFVGLDGYLAHLQEPSIINGNRVDHISLSVALGGLGYEYLFSKHLVAYLYSGYTFRLNNVLRNENRDEVFKLDDVNAFYLRTGLKFKI